MEVQGFRSYIYIDDIMRYALVQRNMGKWDMTTGIWRSGVQSRAESSRAVASSEYRCVGRYHADASADMGKARALALADRQPSDD